MTAAPPPWPLDACWTLFAKAGAGDRRAHVAAWAARARTFLGAELWLADDRDDVLSLDIALDPRRATDVAHVRVYGCAMRDAPTAIVQAAHRAVAAMGGAGFDVLMARATWVWQVEVRDAPRAARTVSASIAMEDLAPALEPGGRAIMGVRGLRSGMGAE